MHCNFTSCTLAPCPSGPDSNLQTVPKKVQTTSCCPDSSKPLVAFAIPRVFSFSSWSLGRYQNGQKWNVIALKRTLSMQPWVQSNCPPRPCRLPPIGCVKSATFVVFESTDMTSLPAPKLQLTLSAVIFARRSYQFLGTRTIDIDHVLRSDRSDSSMRLCRSADLETKRR